MIYCPMCLSTNVHFIGFDDPYEDEIPEAAAGYMCAGCGNEFIVDQELAAEDDNDDDDWIGPY